MQYSEIKYLILQNNRNMTQVPIDWIWNKIIFLYIFFKYQMKCYFQIFIKNISVFNISS